MLKNLWLVALRNIKKDKAYTFLNVIGLSVGITCCLFLIFYIQDELSFDRYHEKADRIVRINSYIDEPENHMKLAITQFVLAPQLKKDFPEVEEAVRFQANGRTMFRNGDLRFYEDKLYYTDSNVFKVFTYQFAEGDPATALREPKSIVLTQTSAEKYFGKNNSAVGKSLLNNEGEIFNVTGVVKDVPKNSHLLFTALISASTLPKDYDGGGWGNFNIYSYVLLKPKTDQAAFEKKLLVLYDQFMAPIFTQFNIKIHYGVQPVADIHLKSDLSSEPEELGSMSYIYIFSAIALFMLIIACINYMNISTARSARRAKEIGIRKVTGSNKAQLIGQFLVESVLTAFIALLVSVVLILSLLPLFNSLSGKSLSYEILFQPVTLLILLGIILFVGIGGGLYPAFYLSKFNPVVVLKGRLSKGSSNVNLRRALIVVQFSISMIMLVCTYVVYNQLQFVRNKDLGFNKEQVISMVVDGNQSMQSKVIAFKDALKANSQVLSVSASRSRPGNGNINFNLFSLESKNGRTDKGVSCYGVDEDYFSTLGIQLTQGRNFSGPPDTLRSIIVNENLVEYFGWKEPLGQIVKQSGDTSSNYLEVIGVIKDFNQKSLYNPMEPLILFYTPNSNNILAKIAPQNIPATVSQIEKSWQSIFPELPFQYVFLDQDFDSQYAADQKRGKIFTAFSILTILITCLGLLGLIAFTTQQRQKEIGIRKVMGAGLMQIVPLIVKNFVVLVGLSCFIAFPVAWYFMSQWLKVFPYNTGLTPEPFLLSAIIILMITLLAVTFHTVKAALANPVKSLRTE
ncbi:MAG TPA: ABC transporter permease [Chitinophagales bacterium]|nr:ABC transporter permease [Chitinophagales bacterium]